MQAESTCALGRAAGEEGVCTPLSAGVMVLDGSMVTTTRHSLFGQSDPYCKVWVNSGEQEVTTAVKKKTLSPYWGEEFILYVDITTECSFSCEMIY